MMQPLALLLRYRKVLAAVTRVELSKRYSGSLLGKVWVVLYPVLLLAMYLFVYVAVFRIQFPGSGPMDYVIYVFCGLIPYIGLMEALTSGCVAIKQNINLIKNVMLPIELIPVRYVLMGMATQAVGLSMLLVLVIGNGNVGWGLIALPLVFALQVLWLIGVVWIVSPLGVALPDTSHFVNLFVLFLMFVSPIGFRPDMVPEALRLTLYFNPVFYLAETYRASLIRGYPVSWPTVAAYAGICIVTFIAGNRFFRRFKNVLVDYE